MNIILNKNYGLSPYLFIRKENTKKYDTDKIIHSIEKKEIFIFSICMIAESRKKTINELKKNINIFFFLA